MIGEGRVGLAVYGKHVAAPQVQYLGNYNGCGPITAVYDYLKLFWQFYLFFQHVRIAEDRVGVAYFSLGRFDKVFLFYHFADLFQIISVQGGLAEAHLKAVIFRRIVAGRYHKPRIYIV